MGTEVMAHCECGLDTTIMIGAGFADFPYVCLFPASCGNCKQVVQANLAEDPVRCPECCSTELSSYDKPALSKGDSTQTITRWGDHILTDGHYQCPACGDMTLRFTESGLLWD
jgi:DNA-directed RNA polymerase subunit RPC12/RpoP